MIKLPPMPASIEKLPRDDRGYPVPWFVAWVDGKPEFRAADAGKMKLAIQEDRCWVCGEPFRDAIYAFVIGPMCAVNRISAEPPSHVECATFSAQACPFLTMPKAVRREANFPAGSLPPAGLMIRRNPGVTLIWITSRWRLLRQGAEYLFQIGDPAELQFWSEGRTATRDEVLASIESGLPILRTAARRESTEAELELQKAIDRAMDLIPV